MAYKYFIMIYRYNKSDILDIEDIIYEDMHGGKTYYTPERYFTGLRRNSKAILVYKGKNKYILFVILNHDYITFWSGVYNAGFIELSYKNRWRNVDASDIFSSKDIPIEVKEEIIWLLHEM
jgi:hypothetical protein